MKNKTIIAKCCYGTLSKALYGLLIMNHNARSVPLFNFKIIPMDLKDILTHVKEINEYSKDNFIIENFNITIKENMINGVKPFLRKEFIRIITPPKNTYTPEVIALMDNILWMDPSSEFEVDVIKPKKPNKYYETYVKRFVTHESYSADTLQLFETLVNKLFDLKVDVPPPDACIKASIFRTLINKNIYSWRRLLSNLLNGTLGADEDVTNYFMNESEIISHIEWIEDFEAASPLMYAKDNRIMTSPAFFEDKTTILPYIIPYFEFSYLPPAFTDGLIVLSR